MRKHQRTTSCVGLHGRARASAAMRALRMAAVDLRSYVIVFEVSA